MPKKNQNINFFIFFLKVLIKNLNIIIRITPVYMVVLMISATLTKYIGEGPIFPENGFELNQCNDTWYLNMLYMNNLIKKDKQVCI